MINLSKAFDFMAYGLLIAKLSAHVLNNDVCAFMGNR